MTLLFMSKVKTGRSVHVFSSFDNISLCTKARNPLEKLPPIQAKLSCRYCARANRIAFEASIGDAKWWKGAPSK